MSNDNDFLNELLRSYKDINHPFNLFIEYYLHSTNINGKIFLIQNIAKYLKRPLNQQFKEIQKKYINKKNCNIKLKDLIDKILEKNVNDDIEVEIREGLEQLKRYNEINHIAINKIAIYVILEELVNYELFKDFRDDFYNLLKKCNITYNSLKDIEFDFDLSIFKDFDEFKTKYNEYYEKYSKGYGTKNKGKLKKLVENLFEIMRKNFPYLLYNIFSKGLNDIIIENENDLELKRLTYKDRIVNNDTILINLIEIIKRIKNNEDLFKSFFRLLFLIFDRYDNTNQQSIDRDNIIQGYLTKIEFDIKEQFRIKIKDYDSFFFK